MKLTKLALLCLMTFSITPQTFAKATQYALLVEDDANGSRCVKDVIIGETFSNIDSCHRNSAAFLHQDLIMNWAGPSEAGCYSKELVYSYEFCPAEDEELIMSELILDR